MTSLATTRDPKRTHGSERRSRRGSAERPASVPASIPAPFLIQYLRHRCGFPAGTLLLTQVGDCWIAIDEAAQIVAETTRGDLCYRECAGESIKVCAVAIDAIDAAAERLRDCGHTVAIAAQIEDPDPETGLARTAVVRMLRARRWGEGADVPVESDGQLRSEVSRLLRMFEQVPPAARSLLHRSLWKWFDRMTTLAREYPDPQTWPADWDGLPSELCVLFLQEICAEVAALDKENQARVLNMIRRFRELLPDGTHGALSEHDRHCMDVAPLLRILNCTEADGESRPTE